MASRVPDRIREAIGDLRLRLSARFGARLLDLRLFGSYARGDFGPDSDVDLLVVVAGLAGGERREVFDLAEEVYFDRQAPLAPLALSDAEWDELVRREYLLAADIRREGVAA